MLFLRNIILLFCLVYLSVADLKAREIPNRCILISIGAWIMAAPFSSAPIQYLAAGAAGGLFIAGAVWILSMLFDKILGKDTLGGGDIKLLFVMGLYLGTESALYALLLACAFGIIFSMVRKVKRGEPFPFGPALSLSLGIVLIYLG